MSNIMPAPKSNSNKCTGTVSVCPTFPEKVKVGTENFPPTLKLNPTDI